MSTLLASKVTLTWNYPEKVHCKFALLKGGSFSGNRELVLEQIGQSVLLGKKMFLATSQTYLKTIGDIPTHTPPQVNTRTNGGVVCVCVRQRERKSTPSHYLHICSSASINSSSVEPRSVHTCQLSDVPCHPWAICANACKSFLLMQGTIKLSNGHNHYVKGGFYRQQFEHCLLPGSADEMSGAQYFKAINLSAFLFSLITF